VPQDGGEGQQGTLLLPDEDEDGRWWSVRWPNGKTYTYRTGHEGKHDLRVRVSGFQGFTVNVFFNPSTFF
jgi:hypothetical protein